MKMLPRGVLSLAVALSVVALGGCADVHQAPPDNVVNAQTAQAVAPAADVPPPRQSSVPF